MVAAILLETSKVSTGQAGGRHLEDCQVARLLAVGAEAANECEGTSRRQGHCNACTP